MLSHDSFPSAPLLQWLVVASVVGALGYFLIG